MKRTSFFRFLLAMLISMATSVASAYASTNYCNNFREIQDELPAAEDIALAETSLWWEIGTTQTFTLTSMPDGSVMPNIMWSSSNENVATVDNSGKVTAVGVGTAAIVAYAPELNKSASCAMTVYALGDVDLDGDWDLEDNKQLVRMLIGFVPENLPADMNRDGQLSIADLTAQVNLILLKEEQRRQHEQYEAALAAIAYENMYHIYTQYNGTEDDGVRRYLTSDGRLTTDLSEAGRFTFHRTEGADLYKSPAWQFDEGFSGPTLSETGEPMPQGYLNHNSLGRADWEGQVWMKKGDAYAVRSTNATEEESGAHTFWDVVSHEGQPAAGYGQKAAYVWQIEETWKLSLSKTSLRMDIDDVVKLTASATPAGTALPSLTWTSSDPNVAEVTSTGMVVAVGYGICTITCTANDGSANVATCEVAVPLYITDITLSANSLKLPMGGNETLTATISPADATLTNLVWTSSDESVATVTASGQVTGVGFGTCTLTCSSTDGSGVTATCEVTVWELVMSQNELTLDIDGFQKLTVSTNPSSVAVPSLTWTSSDENVAMVTASGLVSATGYGTCTITCSANDGSGNVATCEVDVPLYVTGISLSAGSLTLPMGGNETLVATIAPVEAAQTDLVWTSSNEEVATVDASGQVAAIGAGTCTLTCSATDGSGVTTTCEVTVWELVLSPSSLSLPLDGYQKLTVSTNPSTVAVPDVTWASSDENVASVINKGLVYAVDLGTCTITCTATDGSGMTATCEVNVRIQPVTGITLSSSTLNLRLDDTHQLTATVMPTDADNPNVLWTSSDETVATVDQTGMVTAVADGTCTITASAADGSGATATCEVTVILQPVTAITLSFSTLGLNIDDTHRLTATVLPSDADNPNLTWTSSDETVATVDQTGLVTGIAEGTCTITASATDGSGVYATCTAKVNWHDYVDLGLPSGTLWATCNIGADNPEDYGDYFAWGETTGYNSGKTNFVSWSTYKYCNGSKSTLTKYCKYSSYGYNGFTDNLTELVPEDDAAYVNWGSGWRMPSLDQIKELINSSYTTTTWTTQNGVYGRKITSKSNGNSLFLPAAGDRGRASSADNSHGYYWSRTLYTSYPYGAYYLYFYSSVSVYYSGDRYEGRSVRPVRVSVVQRVASITLSQTSLSLNSGDTQTLTATVLPSDATNKGVTWSSSNTAVATVNQSGLVTAVAGGTCTITCTAKDGSGTTATCLVTVVGGGSDTHAYVDLGLPSGTLWATCNIGAENPEDYGLYFAWGETTGYTQDTSDGHLFYWTSYKYAIDSNNTLTKYCDDSSKGYNGFTDNLTELEPEDDAAYVNWGSGWRTPSKEQFDELINSSYTTTTWTTQNGVKGRKITSNSNGNSLFLPAAGYRDVTSLYDTGSYGYYWSRALDTSYPDDEYLLCFNSSYVDANCVDRRCSGRSVRPVRVSQN